MEFVIAHPNIAGAQSYHNSGGMLLRGPGVPQDEYRPQDVNVFDQIGRIGEDGGEIIMIGRKFEKVPTIEGKLYLRIAPLPGSGGSTGSYSVNVSTGGN
jgi:hypothetical protein